MSGAHLKVSARPPRTFAWAPALLLAAAAMLLMESSAQAASKNRGAVLVKDIAQLWRSGDIRRARGRSSRPSDLTAVGKTLFFSARDDRHGTELWMAGAKPCKTAKCKKG